MGSPDRFEIRKMQGYGLGIYFDRFPHNVSVNICLIKFSIYLGFGKAYDE